MKMWLSLMDACLIDFELIDALGVEFGKQKLQQCPCKYSSMAKVRLLAWPKRACIYRCGKYSPFISQKMILPFAMQQRSIPKVLETKINSGISINKVTLQYLVAFFYVSFKFKSHSESNFPSPFGVDARSTKHGALC
ncbi:Hypothetical predicted protein [Octopus vulgaris]|uniref:Uncharacterized protein n=1 Tax=Octopus vulgaris TaxID=6645 RepID=A0AA36F0E3_OCTVU|nr:Hypothetical predicted protein [Octopus vulgaris]